MVAFGLALIYKSNRIINFAQVDMGNLPAVLAASVMAALGWSYWIAVPVALLAAVVLGYVLERGLIRPFAKSPRLILMVMTIAISSLLAGFASEIPNWFGLPTPPIQIAAPFNVSFSVGQFVFHGNDLLAVLGALGGIGLLFVLLRFTNIGIAIRASSENAERTSLLGINIGSTQRTVWIVASLLSTVAIILRGGVIGLPQGSAGAPELLVQALAAAVFPRMESFVMMFIFSCGIGVVETAVIWNKGSDILVDPALFVMLIIALLLQRRHRESRVEDQKSSSWTIAANVRPIPRELASLPQVLWAKRIVQLAALALVATLPLYLTVARINLSGAILLYGIVGLSLVVLTGWGGEISLGQIGFVAIGSATASALDLHYHWDLILTTLAAGAVGAIAAVIMGVPALRIRGLMLAVVTLSFAVTTSSFLLDQTYFHFLPATITQPINRLPILGQISVKSETAFFYVCLIGLLIALFWFNGLRQSRTRRVLVATCDNDRAAQAFGIGPARPKLAAFFIAGFLAAYAGGLLVVQQQAFGQEIYSPEQSLTILLIVVVGGIGSAPGALLGVVFLLGVQWFSSALPSEFQTFAQQIADGVALIGVLATLPGGLGQLLYRVRDAYLRFVANRYDIVVPSLFADVRTDQPTSGGSNGAGATPHVRAGRWIRDRQDGLAPALLARAPRRRPPVLHYLSYPDIGGGPDRSLLSLRAVDVAYGQVQVLFGVGFELQKGQTVAILGTNGAGKSTVLRAVSGLSPPLAGTITFDGIDITGMAPHQIAALGIIQVPGGRGIFPTLTVAENLRMGSWMHRRDVHSVRERTAEVLDLFPGLRAKLDQQAATLSGGQQQMLTLAMAFLAKPRLLMIDELSLGLAPTVVDQLMQVVRRLHQEGITIILVEQSVNVALRLAETAYFMEKGEIRFRGPTVELLERPEILRSVYLQGASAGQSLTAAQGAPANGSDAEPPVAQPSAPSEDERRKAVAKARVDRDQADNRVPVLELLELTKSFSGITAIDGVSLRLYENEILGVIGPNGAGKTTLFDLISGFLQPDRGQITFDGSDITRVRPEQRSQRGLGRSFQDARLFSALTVHETICVALDRYLSERSSLAAACHLPRVRRAEHRLSTRADDLIGLLGLDAFRDKFVSDLSTGSRRIVDLACQIAINPKVILLDEPSSGIAQRETEALGPMLLQIRQQTNASILIVEHDMPLVQRISDRLVALDLGRVIAEGDVVSVLNDPQVISSYLGTTREAIERSGTVMTGVPVR